MSINNSGTSNTGNGGLSGTNLNLNESVGKKRKIKPESKIKFRKNFNTLIEEEVLLKIILYSTLFFKHISLNQNIKQQTMVTEKKINYFSICVPESKFPARKFCAVCGYPLFFQI